MRMSRLNPSLSSLQDLLPGSLEHAVLEIVLFRRVARPVICELELPMPVDSGGAAIAITDTSSLAHVSGATRNGVSVQGSAHAFALQVRDVPGVPQHQTGVVSVENVPLSKKLKQVYTTIALYTTGETASYEIEDIKHSIFEHDS